jgi:hypothetical protein
MGRNLSGFSDPCDDPASISDRVIERSAQLIDA